MYVTPPPSSRPYGAAWLPRLVLEGRGQPRVRSLDESLAMLARQGVVLRELTPETAWRNTVAELKRREPQERLNRSRADQQWQKAVAGLAEVNDVDQVLAKLRTAA